MKLIGRKREIEILKQCINSKRPEFLVIYGRRRVGKTFLVKEFFHQKFSFYATGISDSKTKGQLKAFNECLKQYGEKSQPIPKDWFEAFSRLRSLLMSPDVYRDPATGKMVVFLDEMPWMDTVKSDFKSALDFFWNSFGSSIEDLLLIVCGSATSWIVDNLLKNKSGLHNRVTKRMQLLPFSLKETEALLIENDMKLTKTQLVESYMVFGGIPFYLNLLNPRLSLVQNIEELCFKSYGDLRYEYEELFHSLYKKPEKHIAIVEALANKKSGMTRKELSEIQAIGGGSMLTKNLEELEQCGFIRKFKNFTKKKNEAYYQLIDPFVLFSLTFMQEETLKSWMTFFNSPGYNAWRGNAFENVCLNHLEQIKVILGINGILTQEYSWRSSLSDEGAQIDLLIDRADGVINLCEIKFTNNLLEINQSEYKKIMNRLSVFQEETNCQKAIHITLISCNGLKQNKYANVAQVLITADDLFI